MARMIWIKALYVCIFALYAATVAGATEYNVDRSRDNLVRFISDAPLEDFDGVTDKIDGYVLWDGPGFPPDSNALKSSELYFEVELNGLDTGIGLRNRHMRENYLETDKFPYTHFTARLTDSDRVSDSSFAVTADGSFYIHGHSRPLVLTVDIFPDDTSIRVSCRFEVNLKDYDIDVPSLMFLKIDEIIKVELDFYLKPLPEEN